MAEAPKCPKCRTSDKVKDAGEVMGKSIALYQDLTWACNRCGHAWKEETDGDGQ